METGTTKRGDFHITSLGYRVASELHPPVILTRQRKKREHNNPCFVEAIDLQKEYPNGHIRII